MFYRPFRVVCYLDILIPFPWEPQIKNGHLSIFFWQTCWYSTVIDLSEIVCYAAILILLHDNCKSVTTDYFELEWLKICISDDLTLQHKHEMEDTDSDLFPCDSVRDLWWSINRKGSHASIALTSSSAVYQPIHTLPEAFTLQTLKDFLAEVECNRRFSAPVD